VIFFRILLDSIECWEDMAYPLGIAIDDKLGYQYTYLGGQHFSIMLSIYHCNLQNRWVYISLQILSILFKLAINLYVLTNGYTGP
jgi:hypothetical protein